MAFEEELGFLVQKYNSIQDPNKVKILIDDVKTLHKKGAFNQVLLDTQKNAVSANGASLLELIPLIPAIASLVQSVRYLIQSPAARKLGSQAVSSFKRNRSAHSTRYTPSSE